MIKKVKGVVEKWNLYPFLSVRVLEIVDGTGVPVLADAEEQVGPESVFGHDDKVDKEAS